MANEKKALEFRGKLGDGAYADVYRAFDLRLQREVAVKVIKPEGAGATDALTQARALARVQHPNVGVVFSVEDVRHPDTGEVVSGVVMELIDGEHLDKIVDRGSLDVETARRIGTGILDGLAAIHAEGLYHLDLHGENILVTDALVKIIDIHYLSSLAVISTIPREKRCRHDFTMLFTNLSRVLKACDRSPRLINELQDAEVFDLEEARAAFDTALDAPPATKEQPATDSAARLKTLLLEPTKQIEVRDLLTELSDETCGKLTSNTFSPHGRVDADLLIKRVADYQDASGEIVRVAALLGHWNQEDRHHRELSRIIRRLSSTATQEMAGNTALLAFRWLPFLRVMYSAGIGAVYGDNYASLAAMFRSRVPRRHEKESTALEVFGATWSEIGAREYMKAIPEYRQNYTPLSEYMFATIREPLDGLLKLGSDYERVFDRFEILLALAHADAHQGWGPVGRYGWKLHSRMQQNTEWGALEEEAKAEGAAWGPLRGGLFGGSLQRFEDARKALWETVLKKLNWH